MKIIHTTIAKDFTVEHEGKNYYVSYRFSTNQTLALANRKPWEILDAEGYDLNDAELETSLIKFCNDHLNDYLL